MEQFGEAMTIIVLSVGALVGIGLIGRILWRVGSRYPQARPTPPTADDRRMERLEYAIDAIAIEVERISEAQRFAATLLAERLPVRDSEPALESPREQPTSLPRATTPH